MRLYLLFWFHRPLKIPPGGLIFVAEFWDRFLQSSGETLLYLGEPGSIAVRSRSAFACCRRTRSIACSKLRGRTPFGSGCVLDCWWAISIARSNDVAI